jgi:hypothetical protein
MDEREIFLLTILMAVLTMGFIAGSVVGYECGRDTLADELAGGREIATPHQTVIGRVR